LGPNGAGKTTTIGMLLALIKPTSGRAVVLGQDVQRGAAQVLGHVGAMIEAPAFYPYLSGRDNLRALARAGGFSPRHVEAVLEVVGLASRANDPFRAYSLGMRQRLGIAAALLNDPKLIILDEPTNGLDPEGQREIRELIRELSQHGRTIFLSSHLLHEVENVCERVAILKEGRVIAQGRVAELLHRGKGVLVRVAGDTSRAREILGSVPWVAGVRDHQGAFLVDAPIDRAAELNMLLASQSIPVAEIRAHEAHLEDFFLEITRS
jgi:ABC-2 type transport system ATP-binding protein